MGFIMPIWLWGMMGLAVPVAIHLLSRKESRIIKLGSIRHLDDSITKQAVSFRLNELLLLAIRCALIILLVLLLSGFYIFKDSVREKWLLIESGFERDAEFVMLVDSLTRHGFKLKRLANKFPALQTSTADSSIDYWRLVESINSATVEKAIVLSYNRAVGFQGKRIALPENVNWIIKEPTPVKFAFYSVKYRQDSIAIRNGYSDSKLTTFNTEIASARAHIDSTEVIPLDTISVTIVKDDRYESDLDTFIAALTAAESNPFVRVKYRVIKPGELLATNGSDWIVWFSDLPLPPGISSNIISFSARPNVNAPIFTQPADCPEGSACWIITKRLNSEVALKYQLPIELFSILTYDLPDRHGYKLTLNDRRVLPEKMSWSGAKTASMTASPDERKPDTWIVFLLLGFFLVERLLAIKRNQ